MKQKHSVPGRILAVCLSLLLVCGAFAGCSQMDDIVSNVTAAGEFPVEVNGVTISSKPQRVVVLSPSLADVVLALGYETQLAGASDQCTQDNLADLDKVSVEDAQAVIDLQPDLVLLDGNSSYARGSLEEAGLTVLSVEPATDREDYERLYSQVSSAMAGDGAGYDAGIAAAQDIFITLDNINRIVPQDQVTTACYLYDLDGSGVTGDMFGSTIMSYAGVTNAFGSLTGGTYDFDTLKLANPNLIFCAPGLKEQIESDSRFADFQAVQQGKVVEMDPSLMEWQGRTVVEAAYEISAAAYPELLEDNSTSVTDPTEEIDSQVSSALEQEAKEAQYETLEEGDQGDQVLAVQERLEALGYLTQEYDGHYGATTADCVKRFQKANGLEETGTADPATQVALFAEGALREDGTPLPEEAGTESSDSGDSSSSSSSGNESSSTSSSSSAASSASSSSESSASDSSASQ